MGFSNRCVGVSIIVLVMVLSFKGSLSLMVVMVFAIFSTLSTLMSKFSKLTIRSISLYTL